METTTDKSFDTETFFQAVKETTADKLSTMTQEKQSGYLWKIRKVLVEV